MIRVLLVSPQKAGPDPNGRTTMKKLSLTLTTFALAAGAFLSLPGAVRAEKALPAASRAGDGLPHGENSADGSGDLNNINVTYRGGALLQHAQVSTLFIGAAWQGSKFP